MNQAVSNLRHRIFRATQEAHQAEAEGLPKKEVNKLRKKVRSLQRLMLRSRANVVLSVRRVTQINAGKNTPGVDKVLVKTPAARNELVNELQAFTPWKAKPVKRVYIPKANGKLRALGIPTIKDRAMQHVVRNALEPQWEALFEGCSYGFRPGRSGHDALQRTWLALNARTKKEWILEADIKGAFDNIDQEFLLGELKHFPGKELIKQWLKAGIMERTEKGKDTFKETDRGTPQGGIISPVLLNIALHGMEQALGIKWKLRKDGCLKSVGKPRTLIRYADDFIVACETKEEAEKARGELDPWLAQRGLQLSDEKTRVVPIEEGFDFLGMNIRRYGSTRKKKGSVVHIKPSKKLIHDFRVNCKETWKRMRTASQTAVIKELNPKIRGWANYVGPFIKSESFQELDHWMYQKAFQWAKRRHPQKGRKWVKVKYFGTHDGVRTRKGQTREDQWIFKEQGNNTGTGKYLLKLSWTRHERHTLVKGTSSKDDPSLVSYWENRRKKVTPYQAGFTGRKAQLYKQQSGICPLCRQPLNREEEVHEHHQVPRCQGGKDELQNLLLVHLFCHQQAHQRER